jgi:hypothetical protein
LLPRDEEFDAPAAKPAPSVKPEPEAKAQPSAPDFRVGGAVAEVVGYLAFGPR